MTRIFTATGDDVVRFHLDGGETADAETVLAGVGVTCAALDPGDRNRVYAGTFDDGLFVSADGGESWGRPERGPADTRVMSLAVSPAGERAAYAGTEPSNLYRSEDGGRTWERLPALRELPSEPQWSYPPRPWTHHVRTIAPHPSDPGRLAVGIELGGVMRSLDGGDTWIDHNPQAHSDAHQLVTHPAVPDRLYEVAGQGIALSEDGGDSWQRLEHGLDRRYAWATAVDPADPELWYAAVSRSAFSAHGRGDGQARLLRSNGVGWTPIDTWEATPELQRMPYALIAPAPETLLVGLRGGTLLLTEDAGESWRRLDLRLADVIAMTA